MVLPKYGYARYINFNEGAYFGVVDIVGSIQKLGVDIDDWYDHKNVLKRSFTVMAFLQTQLLCMSLENFNRLKQEFTDSYEELIENSQI